MGAGEVIHSLAVDLFRVGVPPGNTAFIRAELDAFSAGGLCKQDTALQAEVCIQVNATVVRSLCAGQSHFFDKMRQRYLSLAPQPLQWWHIRTPVSAGRLFGLFADWS